MYSNWMPKSERVVEEDFFWIVTSCIIDEVSGEGCDGLDRLSRDKWCPVRYVMS